MTTIPKYICVKCGRGFTTARSGRRHVQNIELGKSYLTTEAEYRVQILTGKIPPPIPKVPGQKLSQNKKSAIEIAEEEFIRGFYHRMGELAYEENQKSQEAVTLKQMLILRTIHKNLE
jgi:hypothetical protein